MYKFVLPILLLLFLASCEKESSAPALAGEGQSLDFRSNKISICHYSADEDQWLFLEIPAAAWADHQAHGDVRLDDQDSDGYVPNNECGYGTMGDCDDLKNAINPGATEICSDDIDNNCDGQVDEDCFPYATVVLVGKTWLAKNLNIEVEDSFCYGYDPENCTKYGRLYTWAAAQTACASIGSGWRLPTKEEWNDLVMAYGGYTAVGLNNLLFGGSSGFNAQLGGYLTPDRSNFIDRDDVGLYWSATEWEFNPTQKAWIYYFDDGQEMGRYSEDKLRFVSCRCVKD